MKMLPPNRSVLANRPADPLEAVFNSGYESQTEEKMDRHHVWGKSLQQDSGEEKRGVDQRTTDWFDRSTVFLSDRLTVTLLIGNVIAKS